MDNQSKYDASRKTVGAMYNDAQQFGDKTPVTNGDLTNELMSSLVEDLNDTIATRPYGDNEFYICVHEKKDLQMPRAILRRIITTKYRPWPEDDTVVFHVNPITEKVKFCWCLPHHTEMDNMLANDNLFDKEMIASIRAWKAVDLYHFGFTKANLGEWVPNLNYKGDKDMNTNMRSCGIIVPTQFISQ